MALEDVLSSFSRPLFLGLVGSQSLERRVKQVTWWNLRSRRPLPPTFPCSDSDWRRLWSVFTTYVFPMLFNCCLCDRISAFQPVAQCLNLQPRGQLSSLLCRESALSLGMPFVLFFPWDLKRKCGTTVPLTWLVRFQRPFRVIFQSLLLLNKGKKMF